MSKLAMTRGSGTTGLLEQPPARSLTRPEPPAERNTAPPPSTSLKPRTIMTSTMSARSTSASAAKPPIPSEIATASATAPARSRFDRIRDFMSRMDDCSEMTAAHRDAQWRTPWR